MKVLLCHNYYQQQGGEDLSFEDEAWLLESRGHDVIRFTMHNDRIPSTSRLRLAAGAIWNREAFVRVREVLRRERPAVIHCTNTFPLMSPSVCHAAEREGVAVVQALRNYRLMCPGAVMMRDGRPCEDCLAKRFAWPSIVHGCYRRSRVTSAVAAATTTLHRLAGTWTGKIDLYFTLTEFARGKFIEFGISPDRIEVKPNFVRADHGPGDGKGEYAVYVGRLSEEKGVECLLRAWSLMRQDMPLMIVGDGPLAEQVRRVCLDDGRVRWLGRQPAGEVARLVGGAACLILPSICYETFGRTIVEAYNRGTPVIASGQGAMAELVDDGETGYLFRPGDADDLARQVRRLVGAGERLAEFRRRARQRYEERYTPEANYERLIEIYRRAIERRRGARPIEVTV